MEFFGLMKRRSDIVEPDIVKGFCAGAGAAGASAEGCNAVAATGGAVEGCDPATQQC